MKFYRIRVNEMDFKVGVEKLKEGLYRVKIGEKETEVVVEDVQEKERTEFVKTEHISVGTPLSLTSSGPASVTSVTSVAAGLAREELKGVVTSMLPGIVLKILVKPGDSVKAGDPVVIIESMKMENEVVSHKNGVVSEVLVKEGQRIETGDALVVIE